MLELLIDRKDEQKRIALVENGRLIEVYVDDEKSQNKHEGSIYVGIVKDVLKGMDSTFIDIGTDKNSFCHLKDLLPKINEINKKQNINIDIKKVVKPNQKVLVQIKKDSNLKKGARVSTHISISSLYVVLMPNTDIVTISQKIENNLERERLLNIVKNNLPKNMGAIIRTSANKKSEEQLINDINNVLKIWENINKKYLEYNQNEPKLLYKSQNIEEKIILDVFEKNLEKVIVNSKLDFENINKFKEEKVELKNINVVLEENKNIFNRYDLEKQIEKLKERRVWLNCGGYITIDKTEALTAIDVNTGKYTGKNNLEETIYKVNQEATVEIAKQLRLRNIGGIIVIDYIDMKNWQNKEKIVVLLKELLKQDRAKTQVEGFTKLDLMELTRKNISNI